MTVRKNDTRGLVVNKRGCDMEAAVLNKKVLRAKKADRIDSQLTDWDNLIEWGNSLSQKSNLTKADSEDILAEVRKL